MKMLNAEGAKKFMDKMSLSEVADLTQTLVNSDILLAQGNFGINGRSKRLQFKIALKCELAELVEAL